ncbi:hypothetical protein E2C01_073797 [Portunus trituberculatus]|uniref:Uncharacterized protein n=1 Tax=Portunus trituberculatus TaxID=210409 RepID=A0A5B7IBL2_PORTR|nr:hypothetical protein [Portunus trituberculatus]
MEGSIASDRMSLYLLLCYSLSLLASLLCSNRRGQGADIQLSTVISWLRGKAKGATLARGPQREKEKEKEKEKEEEEKEEEEEDSRHRLPFLYSAPEPHLH